MTEEHLHCVYHPNREAVTKCEKCSKYICIECKNIYRRRHSTGHYHGTTGHHHSSTYVTQHDYCTPCLKDTQAKSAKGPYLIMIIFSGMLFFMGLIILPIMLSFIQIENSMSQDMSMMGFSPFPSLISGFIAIPIVMLVAASILLILGIYFMKTKAPLKKQKILDEKENFFASLPSQSGANQQGSKLFCTTCGTENIGNTKICKECGASL